MENNSKKFKYWQWRVIICSMIGYAMFYFVRKNFSFAIPLLSEQYGINNASFGLILTIGGLIYGLSKLINGIISDRANARWHLVLGLSVCVLTSVGFGFSDRISTAISGVPERTARDYHAVVKQQDSTMNRLITFYGINADGELLSKDSLRVKLAAVLPEGYDADKTLSAAEKKFEKDKQTRAFRTKHAELVDGKDYEALEQELSSSATASLTEIKAEFDKMERSGQTEQSLSFIKWMVYAMAILYILNQIFQGCGFSPCNRLMVNWVPPHELATKMSIWNTSHSIGLGLISVICGYLTSWQMRFWVPAMIAAVGVLFIILTLRDTPKSVGLPELPKVKGEIDASDAKDKKASRKFLMERVFKNKIIWLLALTDLFVYIVRFAIADWGPTMLKNMDMSDALAGWTVAIFELAGCAGMLCAGYVSDKLFKGQAQRVCAIEMVLVTLCLVALHYIQDMNNSVLLLVVLAVAGFFLYGPQALLGVIASNHATKKAASSAVGLIGFMSYLSTIITGYGFGALADYFGNWHWIFALMGGMAIIGTLLIVVLWNVKTPSAAQSK